MPLPHHRVCALRVGGHGGVSSPLLLSNLVGLFPSSNTLLTCVWHCSESIVSPAIFCASLGVCLVDLLHLWIDSPLDYPYHQGHTEAGLYSVGRH